MNTATTWKKPWELILTATGIIGLAAWLLLMPHPPPPTPEQIEAREARLAAERAAEQTASEVKRKVQKAEYEAQKAEQASPAAAIATPIGKIVTAKGWVKVEHVTGGSAQASVGDLIYDGDVVSTGADGAVGIIFSDGAEFNLASNVSMIMSNSSLFSLTSTRPTPPKRRSTWIERLSVNELRALADGKLGH
jgi:hypothetical protein